MAGRVEQIVKHTLLRFLQFQLEYACRVDLVGSGNRCSSPLQ